MATAVAAILTNDNIVYGETDPGESADPIDQAMAAVVQTVQVFQMVILMKMNVMYVIMIHLMIVLRIVLANGVVMQ